MSYSPAVEQTVGMHEKRVANLKISDDGKQKYRDMTSRRAFHNFDRKINQSYPNRNRTCKLFIEPACSNSTKTKKQTYKYNRYGNDCY